MKADHTIDDWGVFKDCLFKFGLNFADLKVWTFTFVVTPLFAFTDKSEWVAELANWGITPEYDEQGNLVM